MSGHKGVFEKILDTKSKKRYKQSKSFRHQLFIYKLPSQASCGDVIEHTSTLISP